MLLRQTYPGTLSLFHFAKRHQQLPFSNLFSTVCIYCCVEIYNLRQQQFLLTRKRGDWESFLPWRRRGGGGGSGGAASDREGKVDCQKWNQQSAKPPILPVRWFLKHTGFLFATLQVSGGTLENWDINPDLFMELSHHAAGEFLFHLGERNGRGGLSSMGYVAGHESEDYNWWPHSLQRWRLFWGLLYRWFELRRRLSLLQVGLHFQVRKDL